MADPVVWDFWPGKGRRCSLCSRLGQLGDDYMLWGGSMLPV
jgi:hypothetical protein